MQETKSILEFVLFLGSNCSLAEWLILAIFAVFQTRLQLSGIHYGSFYKYKKTSRIKANAAIKEQPVWRRITMTYIGDYVIDRLRKPYKVFIVVKMVLDVLIVFGSLFFVIPEHVEIPYKMFVRGTLVLGAFIYNGLLILLYNPFTRETRFVDFMH